MTVTECDTGDLLYLSEGLKSFWIYEVIKPVDVYGCIYVHMILNWKFRTDADYYGGKLNNSILNEYQAKIICKGTQ